MPTVSFIAHALKSYVAQEAETYWKAALVSGPAMVFVSGIAFTFSVRHQYSLPVEAAEIAAVSVAAVTSTVVGIKSARGVVPSPATRFDTALAPVRMLVSFSLATLLAMVLGLSAVVAIGIFQNGLSLKEQISFAGVVARANVTWFGIVVVASYNVLLYRDALVGMAHRGIDRISFWLKNRP